MDAMWGALPNVIVNCILTTIHDWNEALHCYFKTWKKHSNCMFYSTRLCGINQFKFKVISVSSIFKGSSMTNLSASLQECSHLLSMPQSCDERCWITLRPRTWQERAPFRSASWSFFPSYLRGLATSPCFSRQSQEHSMEKLVSVLVILGDVCIFMKSKHFRVCCNW